MQEKISVLDSDPATRGWLYLPGLVLGFLCGGWIWSHRGLCEDDVVPCAGELTAMAGAGRLAMSAPRLRNRPKGARDQGLQEEGRESRREGGSREQMEGLSFPSAL